jgi:hypothetical protein
MNRILSISAATLLLLATGCNKIKQLANISFDVPYNEQVTIPQVPGYTEAVTIPGGVGITFPTVAVPTNSQQYLSSYGSAISMITNVSLKSLQLQIQAPSTQTFDFLDSVEVYLSAPGLPQVLAASQNDIPKGSNSLTINTNTDLNLKSYYTQDTIYLTLQAHFNATPLSGQTLNIASVFHIIANPLQ